MRPPDEERRPPARKGAAQQTTTTESGATVSDRGDGTRIERVELAHGLVGYFRVDAAAVAARRERERRYRVPAKDAQRASRQTAPQPRRGGGRR